MIYLDPPFGTGAVQGLNDVAYDDTIIGEAYLEFLEERLEKIISFLSNDGFLLIHLDKHAVYEVKTMIDSFGIPFKGDLIWSYRRWSSAVQGLQNNHDTILVYSFNEQYVKQRILIAQSIVAPSSRERVGYPTQKPVKLIKKIIQGLEKFTKVEKVLDPFMGSGTTLVAARELGKEGYGFDPSQTAYKLAMKRLNEFTNYDLPSSRRWREAEL